MRVLFYTTHTYPSKAGGCVSAFRFAEYLARAGHQVTQLATNWDLKHPARGSVSGVSIRRLPYPARNRAMRLAARWLLLPGIIDAVRNADVLIIYGPVPGYRVAIWAARRHGVRVIFRSTMLGGDDPVALLKRSLVPGIQKKLLGSIDTFYAINPAIAGRWEDVFGNQDKVVLTAQGTDVERFRPVDLGRRGEIRASLGLPDDGLPVVLSVGWVVKRKGYSGIFDALSLLKRPFHYVIVGTCEARDDDEVSQVYASEMNELVARGRRVLGPRVRFVGPRDDVDVFMQAADVFLLNSSQEGMPNVVIEAMACGLPVVVRALDGVDGYLTLHDDNALVFADDSSLRENVDRALADAELRARLGRRASDFVRENFSYEAVVGRLF
jgi:glycosyltransferase involved in cell wall biosynthesis